MPLSAPSASYPEFASMFWDEYYSIVSGSGISAYSAGGQILGTRWYQTTPLLGNEINFKIGLSQGDYLLDILGWQNTSCGIQSFTINGDLVPTTIDWYGTSASNTYYQLSVTIPGDGIIDFNSIVTGKNAASTDYNVTICKFWFRKQ